LSSPKKALHILISPNAYKGTLSPVQASQIMKMAIQRRRPAWKVQTLPLADGGDGTLEVLMKELGGTLRRKKVKGPLGRPVMAEWGVINPPQLSEKTAVIEMARASGLALLKGKKNKILEASSVGTGQLIKSALDQKCRRLWIGVGGTATADGGAGALEALGLRYFDKRGLRLKSQPKDLIHLSRIEWKNFDSRLRKTKIYVLCDVKNPLLGPKGSAKTFGPQKGASPKQVLFLEDVMKNWAKFVKRKTQSKPGSGAAGALAFGLSGFARARLVEGTSTVLKAVNWKKAAKGKDWILTGEGQLDPTSFSGKVMGALLKNRGKSKVAVICGSSTLTSAAAKKKGIAKVVEMGPRGQKQPVISLTKATKAVLLQMQ